MLEDASLSGMTSDKEYQAKDLVAKEAISLVSSKMKLGIGSGTTVHLFIKHLGAWVRKSDPALQIICSSLDSEMKCKEASLITTSPEMIDSLDMYIDGADEVLANGVCLKGLGGALTREKLLRTASKRFVLIIDSTKVVSRLGGKVPICVEILQFSYIKTMERLQSRLEGHMRLKSINVRMGSGKIGPVISDNGNLIVDIVLKESLPVNVKQLQDLERLIKQIPGVVETGLFGDPADLILIGNSASGRVEYLDVRNPSK